jgi:hypothetical protein
MEIEIIESRYIVGIGYKTNGDIIECNDDLANNLILQGLAKQKRKKVLIKQKEGE